MNCLISGIAGDIGLGVARILQSKNFGWKIHGMDIQSDHPGSFFCDYVTTSPRADDRNYINWLFKYIQKNNIDFFIPTSEAEILRLYQDKIELLAGAVIVITNNLAIEKGLDKHECLNYLSTCGVPVPEHGLLNKNTPISYPCIIKPRAGQGSKGLRKVYSAEQLPTDSSQSLVWQEYLDPDDEEYTCPIFRSNTTGTRSLVIRRTLQGGYTSKGEVINNYEINDYLNLIAKSLDLNGVMNVQLRLTNQGPRLFEINPRLSSTLVFRDKMGFCDLDWLISLKLGLPISGYIPPSAGTRFYRGNQEYIINGVRDE